MSTSYCLLPIPPLGGGGSGGISYRTKRSQVAAPTKLLNSVLPTVIKNPTDPQSVIIKLMTGKKIVISLDFIEWFRGFVDAEDNFRFSRTPCVQLATQAV